MGFFGIGKSKGETLEEQTERLGELTRKVARYEAQLEELRELVRHLDEELNFLMKAQEMLQPGLGPKVLSEALLELCFKPFGLASFYVALVDYPKDEVHYFAYHEGGRIRNHPVRGFSTEGGLTNRTITERKPRYVRDLEEARVLGARFSDAELASGLIPQTWYGVPLGKGERSSGLVSYQSFQPDAFMESRRQLMDALSGILALALVAPKD